MGFRNFGELFGRGGFGRPLGQGGGGSVPDPLAAYVFGFRDEFTTGIGLLTTPTRVASHVGGWNTVDGSAKGSITVDDTLAVVVGGTFNPALVQDTLQAKVAGRLWTFRIQTKLGTLAAGLMNATAVASIGAGRHGNLALSITSLSIGVDNGGDLGTGQVGPATAYGVYQLSVVEQPTGLAYFAKGGSEYLSQTLLFVDLTAHEAGNGDRAVFHGGSGTPTNDADFVRQTDLTGALATGVFYSLNQSNPVSGTQYAIENNALTHAIITAPAVLATSAELRICEIDASNYISMLVDSAGAFSVVETVAGVPNTLLASVAGVWTNGSTRRIVVQKYGLKLRVWTWVGTVKTVRLVNGTINAAFAIAGVQAKVILGALWTSSQLISWPANSSNYNILDTFGVVINAKTNFIVFDGDSLTFGTSLDPSSIPYPTQCLSSLNYRGYNSGVPGATSADVLVNVTTEIDAKMDIKCNRQYAVLWIGANDLTTATTAATIESNIQSWCTGRKATGAKVIICTITPRTGLTGPQETKRTDVNTWLNANFSTFADGIVDLAADSRLSNASNLTYYDSGGTHMTLAGYGVVAQLVTAKILALP